MKKHLDLVFRNSTKSTSFKKVFFEKILLSALKEFGLDKQQTEISINIVGETKMKTLNHKYRGKDKTTDVLSFPVTENPLKTPISQTGQTGAIMNLGDIFISSAFNTKKELKFLTVHGLLHLLGYDHENEAQEKKMFNLQERILEKI